MLTPQELKSKQLEEKKKRFYDKEEVDTLLHEVYANYQELYTKYEELGRNAKKLSDGVQYYRSIETTLQKALVLAEKTAKETKDAAEVKAASIESEANEKAKMIISDAEKDCEKIKLKCNHLVDLFKQYKSQFITVTDNNLKLLNSKEFDIDAPELEAMYQEQKPETEIGIKKQLENTQDLVAVISSNLGNPPVEPMIKKVAEEPAPVQETPVAATPVEEVPVVEPNAPEVEAEVEMAKTQEIQPVQTEETVQQTQPVPQTVQPVEEEVVQPPKIQYGASEPAPEPAVAIDTQEIKPLPEVEQLKEEVKEEKSQTLDALLNDLNMNNKKKDDEDPFEFLGSLDDF